MLEIKGRRISLHNGDSCFFMSIPILLSTTVLNDRAPLQVVVTSSYIVPFIFTVASYNIYLKLLEYQLKLLETLNQLLLPVCAYI